MAFTVQKDYDTTRHRQLESRKRSSTGAGFGFPCRPHFLFFWMPGEGMNSVLIYADSSRVSGSGCSKGAFSMLDDWVLRARGRETGCW